MRPSTGSVDFSPAAPCTSPERLQLLEEGSHVFSVYALDPDTSSADPAPATRTFVLLYEESEDGECERFEEGEEDEGEEDEENFEEGPEEGECEAEARASRLPPSECRLRGARARILVHGARSHRQQVIAPPSRGNIVANTATKAARGWRSSRPPLLAVWRSYLQTYIWSHISLRH